MHGAKLRIWAELAPWLALALLAFTLTFDFSGEVGTYQWGAASWPRGVILLIAIMASAQFALRLRLLRRRSGSMTESLTGDDAIPPDVVPRSGLARIKLAIALCLPLLYAYLLPLAGFYATTPFFLCAYLALLGERRPLVLVATPIFIYAVINLVFTKLFYVALPTGNWPGFYEFSNWFLITVR